MLNGGYILLDLTAYENGETYTGLKAKLKDLLTKGKPLVVQVIENSTPINSSIIYDSVNDAYEVSFISGSYLVSYGVDTDGELTITSTSLVGE